jgi:formylglycine-generating enzyme required for sulfatase activity
MQLSHLKGLPWRVRDNRSGMVFLLCPKASVIIGSTALEHGHKEDEGIATEAIPRPFYLGETAVTQGTWERLMGSNPSVHQGAGLPVDNITAWDCIGFLKRLGPGFRFPREAEWEYACRAGSETPFSHADQLDADAVNYHGQYPYPGGATGPDRRAPVPVGSLPPNRWGFHEMLGNVWEWCSAHPARVAMAGDRRIHTVLRGGSWGNHAHSCRCASRMVRIPEYRRQNAGFRVVREAGGPGSA